MRLLTVPRAAPVSGDVYYRSLLERVAALDGVRAAGFARAFMYVGDDTIANVMQPVSLVGDTAAAGELRAALETVSPGFFDAVGIPLREGRAITWEDTSTGRSVAVVSESVARRLAPGQSVLGRYIRLGTDPRRQRMEVVGVTADATLGPRRAAEHPVIYRSAMQERLFAPTLQIRIDGDPLGVAAGVREAVAALGRDYVFSVARLESMLGRSTARERLASRLVGFAGLTGCLLAFTCVYALLAYSVTRRTREIGVRVALGAAPADMNRMMLRESLWLWIAGLAIGIPGSIAAARAMRTLLFGITASDPVSFVTVALCLGLLTLVAALPPAYRAATIDPAIALRAE